MHFPKTALLNWFSTHQRKLPWRKKYDSYHVWVSEVMLQQTRVDQMQPFFERFLKRFPTVQKLAQANEQDVLKTWEGLGYYSRARNLHKAAQQIVAQHQGQIPTDYNQLILLSGFGPYIAAAVASIAFNKPVAVVDGNVLRVLARYYGNASDVSQAATKKEFQDLAQQILPVSDARNFNQATMELGALVCLPKNPLCSQCPLKQTCFAFQNNQQEAFPVKTPKKTRPIKNFAAVLVQHQNRVWLVKRQQKLLQGLWEFPSVAFQPLTDSRQKIEHKFKKTFGVQLHISSEQTQVWHDYTHFRQKIVLFKARADNGTGIDWTLVSDIKRLPLSKVNHKLWQHSDLQKKTRTHAKKAAPIEKQKQFVIKESTPLINAR